MMSKYGARGLAGMGVLLALALSSAGRAESLLVTTAQEAVAAVRRAQPGDEIILAEGEYKDFALTLAAKGQAEKPVRLRPAKPGAAILTGSPRLEITGAFVEIEGLVFRDCTLAAGTRGAVVFNGSRRSRLTDCTFENSILPRGAALVTFRNGAHDNLVDGNCFLRTRHKAVMVVVDDLSLKTGPPLRNRIERNRFQDVPPLRANGAETIQIGQRASPHSDLRTGTLVADNEFIRCDGEAEIISVKTSGNLIRSNSFRECKGELVMRHGHSNTATGNRFEGGSGGIRVSGHAHLITDNFIRSTRGTGIQLYYGTPDLTHPAAYGPVFDCVIRGNTITDCAGTGILIGGNKNARYRQERWGGPPWFANPVMECTVAPYHNRVVSNTVAGKPGRLLKVNDAPRNAVEHNSLNGVWVETGPEATNLSGRGEATRQ